jgi:hypothetical protein
MTITLDGTAGMTAPVGAIYNGLQTGTLTSATGSAVLFSSIPLWVKRITILFQGVSLSGTDEYLIQIGSGTLTTSGYTSAAIAAQSGALSSGAGTSTSGFLASAGLASGAYIVTGSVELYYVAGNAWISRGLITTTTGARACMSSGSITLSGSLDRVSITNTGASTFDAGSFNIIYE